MDERKQSLARTFDLASDQYAQGPAASWERIGVAVVAAADPREGERILDVASGAGTTALPAAELVGPTGSVIAVDLSQGLLSIARESARQRGLTQLTVRLGDYEHTGYDDGAFDVVQCSLGIFFVPDIPAALRELWRMVAPGGRLAVSTWAGDSLGALFDCFFEAVQEVWPDLPTGDPLPWSSISTPSTLSGAFLAAGTTKPVVTPLAFNEPIADDEHLWAVFMGSGLRAMLSRFTDDELAAIRRGLVQRLTERGITSYDFELLIAVATRARLNG